MTTGVTTGDSDLRNIASLRTGIHRLAHAVPRGDAYRHGRHHDTRTVRLIGVPLDLGASRRGVDMGPSALRIAQLAAALERLATSSMTPATCRCRRRSRCGSLGGGTELDAITAVCRDLAAWTAGAIRGGAFPVVLGGDHSLAVGSVPAPPLRWPNVASGWA